MSIQEDSKIEYMSRINQVVDYIEKNLDQPLKLNDIASIANFSPYHFHRIFTSLVGETPFDYIQRLRMEKAVWKLQNEPKMSIVAIADYCGFGSAALFNKAFKKYFGICITQFRKSDRAFAIPEGKPLRKIGKVE